jgi:SNF2 family DNA or RNA helicase
MAISVGAPRHLSALQEHDHTSKVLAEEEHIRDRALSYLLWHGAHSQYTLQEHPQPMNNNNPVLVELSANVDRIEVHFKYDPEDVAAIKTITGRRWHDDDEGKRWSVPMDMRVARRLRELYGDRMQLGPAVKWWAKEQVVHERRARSLAGADDADLERTPKVIMDVIAGRPIEHPTIPPGHVLRRKRAPRPYQRADIKLMSMGNTINANDVGTGKTLEAIAAIYEAGVSPKPVLIVAPKRSLVNVWKAEFDRLSDYELWTSEMPSVRHRIMAGFNGEVKNLALALIADDLRLEKYRDVKKPPPDKEDQLHACRDYKGNWYRFKSKAQQALFQIEWGAFIIDEFHQTGLPNRTTLFHLGAQLVKAERKWPMSGTPIGGKPRRLWPILNFIDRKQYSSEWAWIGEWLEVIEDKVFIKGGRGAQRKVMTVGGIKPGTEEEFYEHHKIHMVRRTKKDALPGIPDAIEIIVPTPMAGKQLSDYREFDEAHELVVNGKRLSGSIVLAQYTRLRQFANARLEWDQFYTKPIASKDSCKFDYLLERLDENGIRRDDWEPGARAYIGVLEISYMERVAELLRREGIDCDTLHGGTKDSKPILDKFAGDSERPYVIVMTIKTGGTALNLERANSAHALDEEWDPDIMHQFFGRGDRGARDTPLKCYTYRTPDSIQEYVAKVAGDKKVNNRTVLNYVRDIEALRRGEAR